MVALFVVLWGASLAQIAQVPANDQKPDFLIGTMLVAEGGYQYADFKDYRGMSIGFFLGVPVAKLENLEVFLEAGFTEVRPDRVGLPNARLMGGTRVALLRNNLSLHVNAHFGYGQPEITAQNTIIDIGFVDMGFAVFYDIIKYSVGPKASLGIFVSTAGHRTVKEGSEKIKLDAFSGRSGLSLIIW